MKIGFSFFGITYGPGGRTGSSRDFRHCWPNIKQMLIDPFIDRGHLAKIYFSTYTFTDLDIYNQFFDIVKPDGVVFSDLQSSTSFTSKIAAFDSFRHSDVDVIIFTRSDIHFNKIIATEDINWNKFNFLFPEFEWWNADNFTCDNFYMFPKSMTLKVELAMHETFRFPRPDLTDTHGLYTKLIEHISPDQIHFISNKQELSDVNSFYTCCRDEIPLEEDRPGLGKRSIYIHPEVREKFYK